jgi:hypothetical protein
VSAATDIEETRQLPRLRAAGGDETAFRKFFRRDLHAGLVRNMRQVGVLTPEWHPISMRSGFPSPPRDRQRPVPSGSPVAQCLPPLAA